MSFENRLRKRNREGLYDVSARVSAGVPPMWPHDGDVPLSARRGGRAGFYSSDAYTLAIPNGACLPSSARPGWGQPHGFERTSDREAHAWPRQQPCDLPMDSYTTERKAGEGALASSSCLRLLCAGQYEPNSEQNT